MSLKSAKKFIDRALGRKSKTRYVPTENEPVETPPVRAPETRAENRPQIGGHRAPGRVREGREPLIGTHRNAPTEQVTQVTPQPGFVRGVAPEGGRSGAVLGGHRAWQKGEPATEKRAEVTIGKDRKVAKALEKQEAKGKLPPEVKEDVKKEIKKEAPPEVIGKKEPQAVPEAPAPKIVQDVVDKPGPKNAKDTPLANPSSKESKAKTPVVSNPLDNYTTPNPLDNYTTPNPLDNYTTNNLRNDGGTSNYTTNNLDNYGGNSNYTTNLVDTDDNGNYRPLGTSTDDAPGMSNYGTIGTTFELDDDVPMFSSSSESELAISESREDPMVARALLVQRVKKAKAAKRRAEKASEPAPETTSAPTPVEEPPTPDTNLNYTTVNDNTSNYSTSTNDTSNYTPLTDNASETDDEPFLFSSSQLISSSNVESDVIRTDKMSFHSAEIDMLSALEDAAENVPEVQEKYHGSANPEVAGMQQSLREGRKNLYDVPEQIRDLKTLEVTHRLEIERERLSKNERESKGWALIGMRTNHRNTDLGKSASSVTWNVKYAMSEYMEIEQQVADLIGSHMAFQREEFLCEIYGGKLVDVAGQHVDTNHNAIGGQAQRERISKLHERMQEAREKGLGDKVDKLEKKLNIALKTPAKDKNIAGKFIYVMNAAGQFFATKPEQFKVHHSTMLASGAVACAGEIQVSGGVIKSISNMSGHYRPGPVFLWQAVKQLEMNGAPMDFSVDVVGVSRKFKSASEFLGAMNPAEDPKLFDGAYAAKVLNGEVRPM